MKKTLRCLLSLVCIVGLSGTGVAAYATDQQTTKTTKAHTHKAPVKAKSKTGSKKSATKSGGETVQTVKTCRSVHVKTAKGYRTTHKCSVTEGALHSPIDANAINAQSTPGKQPELKARTIPDRAYAVDGYTFFHQGRKYRVIGIDEALVPAGSDLAKQRLQLALDGGAISVEPEAVDENGTMRALVRVGGKNLADILNARR
jgi:hypothetical protein